MQKEDLKKVHLAQLDLLIELKRVCDKNGIKFWLAYGSMLGAVRHKGFIPWDDDLDVAMTRADYKKLRAACDKDLDPEYEYQDWDVDTAFGFGYAKLRIRGTHFVEQNAVDSSAHNGIFIDIFPYDNGAPSIEEEKKDEKLFYVLKRRILAKNGYMPADAGLIKRIAYFAMKHCPGSVDSLKKKIEKKIEERAGQSSDYLICHYGAYGYMKERMPGSIFSEIVDCEFEKNVMPIPVGYKEYLTQLYRDYMQFPPESERENRHCIVELDFGSYKIRSTEGC